MACALTQSVGLDCRSSVGGIKKVYVTEIANATTITAASGVVTAITMATGKRFWDYSVDLDIPNEWTENGTGSRENGTLFYEQSVTLILNGMSASKRNELHLLAKNRLLVIIQDRNDVYWLAGESNGLMVTTNNAGSGAMMDARNGYTLTLAGKEAEPANTVDSTIIAALLVAAS